MKKIKFKYTIIIFSFFSLLLVFSGFSSWFITNSKSFSPVYSQDGDVIASLDATSVTYNGLPQLPINTTNAVINFKDADTFLNYSFSYKIKGSTGMATVIEFNTAYVPFSGPTDAGDYEIIYKDKTTNNSTSIYFTILPVKLTSADLSNNLPTLSDTVYGELPVITQPTGNFLEYTLSSGKKESIGGTYSFKNEDSTRKTEYLGTSSTSSVSTLLTFTPNNSNYVFEGDISSKYNLKAVAYSGDTYYGRIETAIGNTTSGTIYVIPGIKDNSDNLLPINVFDSFTIKNGITLALPYEEETIKSSEAFITIGNTVADSTADLVKKNMQTLVKLINSSCITIEKGGTIQIGGVYNRIGVAGLYAQISLGTNSSITCSGKMECYGYIKEDSSTAINSSSGNTNDNSTDTGRFVEFTSTGELTYVLAVKDGTGGSALASLAEAGTCPLNEFDFPCIQTYTIFDYGAKADCNVKMTAANKDLEKTIEIFRAGTGEKSVFNIISGHVVLEYIPKNANYTNNTSSGDKTKVIINGTLEIGYMNFDVTVAEIDTRNYPLPISYKINVVINDNSTLKVVYGIKFLPGSSLYIEENGTLELNSSLSVYKNEYITSLGSADAFNYPKNLADASFINNGTINVSSAASIGAFISHTNSNNTAKVNLSNVTQSSLTATTREGTNQKEIIIPSTALFNIENQYIEKQIAGKQTLTSLHSNNNYYWSGGYYDTLSVTVDILDHEYKYPIFNYTIMYADDENGTNAELLSATNATAEDTYEVIYGKYINVIVNRENSSFMNINNNSLQITQDVESRWYQVESNIVIEIMPNEGKQVIIKTSGNSGAGKVEYTIYEAKPNSTDFVEVGSTSIGSITAYVIKDYQFKFTTASSYGIYFTTKPYYKDSVQTGVHGTENYTVGIMSRPDANKLGNNTIYIADADYLFDFKWNFTEEGAACITADTLITLADGTKKQVQDLSADDLLLVFNHETGKYEFANIIFIDIEPERIYRIVNLKFSDGTIVKVVYEHGFFDLDLNKYVYIREDNMHEFIGHKLYQADFDGINYVESEVTLVDAYVTEELTTVYSPVTVYHLNYFTEDMLSMPAGIPGLFNIFEFGDNLTYDEEQMQADIEKYGLYTYDDFKDYISYEVYMMFPAPYLKVAVGKGLTTYEDIVQMIYTYLEKHDLMKNNNS